MFLTMGRVRQTDSGVPYRGSGVWVVEFLHSIHEPLPLAEFDKWAFGEPATVFHPRLVRPLPCFQASLAVETSHKVHVPCGI